MNEHAIETYKSMINISVEAMKALLLINGGAVIAILTFLGTENGRSLAAHSSIPLSGFIAGLVFSVCTFTFSYASQFALFNETVNNSSYHGPRHMTFVAIAVVFVVLSMISFAIGCASSIWVLTNCA